MEDPVTALARVSERHRTSAHDRQKIMMAFAAEANRTSVVDEYAARYGKSTQTFYRDYYNWKRIGIAALVPKASLRKNHTRMSDQFIEWFKGLCQEINTDSVPAARRRMLERLAGGERIPGLGTWRERWSARFPEVPHPSPDKIWPRDVDALEDLLPAGMSPRNMLRHKGELVELVAARQGNFAAKHYGPQVFTTRVGLAAGQVLICDDVWHNVNVNWTGSSRALRPIELCMLDALTAHKVAWGMRPRTWNEETKKHETIKEHEFRYLLAYAFCEAVGYRREGTILWLERGTAAVDEDLAGILAELSHGAITVKRAPLKDARQLCSMYRSVSSGNPNFKSPLEAHHNVGHTELSHVVGQVGRSRDLQPEELYGRDEANKMLLKIQAVLPPEMAAMVDLPFMQWEEYLECVITAYENLAWRPWHKLEGWEACKFFRKEFRPAEHAGWLPLDSLMDMPPQMAEAFHNALQDHPELCRIQPLSPIEAWQKTSRDMVKVDKCGVPLILGPKNGIVRQTPDEQYLRFGSRELGSAPHIYRREYTDQEGFMQRMEPGRAYLFHINPFSPTRELFISEPNGRYLGSTERVTVPCRADQEAVLEQIKRKKAEWGRIAERVQGRSLTKLAKEAAAMSRNARVVGAALDAGLLPGKNMPQLPEHPTHDDAADDADAAILEIYGKDRSEA